jgi:hypothetical protein
LVQLLPLSEGAKDELVTIKKEKIKIISMNILLMLVELIDFL